MSKYNFVDAPNRSQLGSGKWKGMLAHNPNVSEDIIPFSVADMEFYNAPELTNGLAEYAKQAIYGYTGATDKYYDAIINYMKDKHDWNIQKEWIVEIGGVVPALFQLVQAYTEKGDGVIITRPVYYPFTMAIEKSERKIVNVSLIENEGKYTIDFDALEKAAKREDVKLMIFCSPHNPIGRVWTKDELRKMGDICVKNNIIIISDEIHFDFIMDKHEHTVISTLSEEIAKRTVVCTAPSKTFNLGGVKVSNIIIQNPEYREKYVAVTHSLNTFAYKTCEIVYTECREWFEELMEVLHENKKLVEDFVAEHLPMIKVYPLEGT